MKHKLLWGGWVSLFLLLPMTLFLLSPLGANGQTLPLKFKTLAVSIWPEYDRPEVLVIYRARLSPDTSLPAQLTFRLPGYIEDMHAVAIEQNGALVSVNPDSIELIHQEDDLLLTFPTASPNVHFEYYDPAILTKQNQTRQLTFDFSASHSIEMITFEVQQPFQAEKFSLVPEPDNTFSGEDGLRYNTISVTDLAPGDTFNLSATYRRNTGEVSVQRLRSQAPGQPLDILVVSEASSNGDRYLGYTLVGVGVILLLGTGGYWWLRQTQATTMLRSTSQKDNRRRARRKKERKSRPRLGQSGGLVAAAPANRSASSYCYRCGVALYEEAKFCHLCGAERRQN